MTPIYTSKRYNVQSEGNGARVLVTRLADMANLFLQGDDAGQFLAELEAAPSGDKSDQVISQFDDVFNPMTIEDALRFVGFELRPLAGNIVEGGASVYRGTAPVEPTFGFAGAFEMTDAVWLNGERRDGRFLVCLEPGTGNLMQVFDLQDNGRFLGR